MKSGAFATRTCQATLHWRDSDMVVVPHAEQVDVDLLGVDLGTGKPVVTFIVQSAPNDTQRTYEVWSIEGMPKHLLTVRGGDTYKASDAENNGHVAVWTADAAAVQDFDGLSHADIASPPIMVLRLGREGLLDISAWYQAEYDVQIDGLRRSLTQKELDNFRKSNGRASEHAVPPEQETHLRKTKATVLEIVWAYLYSGRSDQAWTELSNSWPPDDIPRIKAAILKARSGGISAQVAKALTTQPSRWSRKLRVYEALQVDTKYDDTRVMEYGPEGANGSESQRPKNQGVTDFGASAEPEPISLWRPPLSLEDSSMRIEEKIQLTIDVAGKVKQAVVVQPQSDPHLLEAAKSWKFIPAFLHGTPVMYRTEISVHPFR